MPGWVSGSDTLVVGGVTMTFNTEVNGAGRNFYFTSPSPASFKFVILTNTDDGAGAWLNGEYAHNVGSGPTAGPYGYGHGVTQPLVAEWFEDYDSQYGLRDGTKIHVYNVDYSQLAGIYDFDFAAAGLSAAKFVAVSRPSNIGAISSDGITWTERTLPATANWQAIAQGAGIFVAIAHGSNIAATSPDGITWTQRTLPANTTWSSVTFGAGLFVAVSQNSNIAASSPDGVTWTQRTLPTSANWFSVTYGGTLFVAVANSSTIAATSPDGITWTQRTLPVSAEWASVTYGENIFVTVATDSTIAASSPDGITWTQRVLPVSAGWQSVAYGNGLFVAVAISTPITATSPDGINWFQRSLSGAGWDAIPEQEVTGSNYPGPTTVPATITMIIDSAPALGGSGTVTYHCITDQGVETLSFEGSVQAQFWGGDGSTDMGGLTIGDVDNAHPPFTKAVTALQRIEYSWIPNTGTGGLIATWYPEEAGVGFITDHFFTEEFVMEMRYPWNPTYTPGPGFVTMTLGAVQSAAGSITISYEITEIPAGYYMRGYAGNVNDSPNDPAVRGLYGYFGDITTSSPLTGTLTFPQYTGPVGGLPADTEMLNYFVEVNIYNTNANALFASTTVGPSSSEVPERIGCVAVAYGEGLFAAVKPNTDMAVTSPDGVTWTERTLPEVEGWSAITSLGADALVSTSAVWGIPV